MLDNILPIWLSHRIAYTVAGLLAYASLCRLLRFRRLKQMHRKYGFGAPDKPFSSMTNEQAHEILLEISEAEFPTEFERGLQLALLRTYGVPSISKLLNQTAQLSTTENVGKRYADTATMIIEIYSNSPTDKRGNEVFARLNYLHGHYLKQGRITNDDMLYTLALFMSHPVEWINKIEWRTLSDLEVCALATFHKDMGEAMHISYDVLPSAKEGWKDGLHFYKELVAWADQYELDNMRPHDDNYKTAVKTKELLLGMAPKFTHPLVSQLVFAAMDDRLREALKFPAPKAAAVTVFNNIMAARKFVLRYLSLPRFEWQRNKSLSKHESPEGRRWLEVWSITPHFVKPTLWNRWGPGGIYRLAIGAARPGDKGMMPEGYLRSNMGPRAFEGKGIDEFEKEKTRIGEIRTGGCPFARSK